MVYITSIPVQPPSLPFLESEVFRFSVSVYRWAQDVQHRGPIFPARSALGGKCVRNVAVTFCLKCACFAWRTWQTGPSWGRWSLLSQVSKSPTLNTGWSFDSFVVTACKTLCCTCVVKAQWTHQFVGSSERVSWYHKNKWKSGLGWGKNGSGERVGG